MKKSLIITLTAGIILMSPNIVLAQTTRPVPSDRITLVKSKADAEITRRIGSINELISKIEGLRRVSDTDKANFVATANSQVTNLSSLKTKIDADTDISTLRTDQKSIMDEYRIYLLFIPQTRILIAADRMGDTVDLMNQVSTKLASRINGNSTLQTTLNDANAKLMDAKTQYANAETAVSALTPDNGDTVKAASNKQALLSGRTDLQAGLKDLQTARTDFQTIINALKTQPTPTP